MSALVAVRWLLAGVLGAASIHIAALNWSVPIWCLMGRRRGSWMPLFGGLFGVAALLLEPTGRARAHWWIPLVADFGSIPGFALTGAFFLARWWRPSKDLR